MQIITNFNLFDDKLGQFRKLSNIIGNNGNF